MTNDEGTRFINIKAAAQMLGVSPLTLRNWDKKKKLTALRHPINNYRVYRLGDIQQFLNKIANPDNPNRPRKIKIEFLSDDLPSNPEDQGELKI